MDGWGHPNNHRPPPYPPSQQPLPPQQQFDPNLLLYNLNLHLQNLNQSQNPYFYPPQQNPNFIPHQLPPQPPPPQQPQPQLRAPGTDAILIRPHNASKKSQKSPSPATTSGGVRSVEWRKKMEKVDAAVAATRRELVAGKEHVSSWKVSQLVLVKLKVESWDSLGLSMQEVPSLRQLILTEGKIGAFIHCHVAAQRITSLFDLREAICKNEGVEKFEELQLGPFLRQPLVMHYFSVSNDAEEVYEITSEKIVSYLFVYLYRHSNVQIEEFLDYVAKKCKVTDKEKLGVRIQSLGMHIGLLHKARGAQQSVLRKYMDTVDKSKKKRPLLSLQKKELDDRFSSITQRLTSFASGNKAKEFGGQHIRFCNSSSDELEDPTDSSDNEEKGGTSSKNNQSQSSTKSKSGDKVSNCPYPSVAEERSRLGLGGEMAELHLPSDLTSEPAKKKRKVKKQSDVKAVAQSSSLRSIDVETGGSKDSNNVDHLLAEDSIRMFITTWKEACREHTAAEVLETMLDFYNLKKAQRKILRRAFSTYPLVGLLNVTVTSIKRGMWDSMYDTFQSINAMEQENKSIELMEYVNLDVQPIVKKNPGSVPCVNVEDIVQKASDYLFGSKLLFGGVSLMDRVFKFVELLSLCERWLTEQFSVGEFRLLGHGDFWSFIGKNASLLPKELLKFLSGKVQEKPSIEVTMVQHQLLVLLSQASGSLWEDDVVTKEKLSELLMRQFPLIKFATSEIADIEQLLISVRQHRSSITSSCLIFSATLLGTSSYADTAPTNTSETGENSELADMDNVGGYSKSVTSRDAIELFLKAPFLSDLKSWSHWDSIYAPTLGPLMDWLLTEVNVKGLLCLLTRYGQIIRIDHSASEDLFFQALIQESPFRVAVQLLSLFALSGGRRHVPVSLLKCHARQGFEVLMANSMQSTGSRDGQRNEKIYRNLGSASCDSSIDLVKKSTGVNGAVGIVSRVFIDSIAFMPSEFRCFAADILLSGLRSMIKDVASTLLLHCKGSEERLMLHEVGFSLGIVEWIDDHHTLCPVMGGNSLTPVEESSSISVDPDVKIVGRAHFLDELSASTVTKDGQRQKTNESTDLGLLVADDLGLGASQQKAEQNFDEEEAALLIESIRREEFGLVAGISDVESCMLQKQHARLGRALHCLSQELYSQDSHFLLELVQNADDNAYPVNVEPTLCFILQDTSIIVLNNEQGFTAKNIRALCDVGNSTKKGCSAGYIGQKGIGFKSVFRVTDAPEIHSNGFHIKFDISEGQIGFVLPTVVPPCDSEMFRRLASRSDGLKNMDSWNTCIVLPFKSKLSEGSAVSSISSMFLDLHPSLLLFLHRLQCIKLRNVPNNTFVDMRKEILGNGIVRVSNGSEMMTWFIASYQLHPKISRLNVHRTEISIAFTLEETVNGDYKPILAQQPVFAFLPLRAYGLKFILQADFILPSSREEVDGDSPWNQWLLSEFPSLFVDAEKTFCSLSCFQENPAIAVSAYMSFVPLVGEVHGFFSGLPRMILSKLRQSNCLLQDGSKDKWVAPCKLLRGWNELAQKLLPDTLLYEHLGVGLLHRNIDLSDPLARALGVEEYGPKTLVQFISSLGSITEGIKSMGLGWLALFLNELDIMSHTYAMNLRNSGLNEDLINRLKKVPFIPLCNGTYGSLDEGTIWLHADYSGVGVDGELGNEAFPSLNSSLRIVNPALFSESSGDLTILNNCSRMLQRIGVQEMSAHGLIKSHILPSLSDDRLEKDQQLITEYMTFIMVHLQSNCVNCRAENEHIISELCSKALIQTNYGYKRPIEVPMHFSGDFGNSVDAKKFLHGLDYAWHEVDMVYLRHPVTKSLSSGLTKWREFFQKLGVTDFVKVAVAQKTIAELPSSVVDQIKCGRDLISPGLLVKDWVSTELVHILSLLSKDGNRSRCRYILEVLDALWDDHYCDKVLGCSTSDYGPHDLSFKSSLSHCISDSKWVVSSMDKELHYPRELFYDCDGVRSVLGCHAPYAVPKIKSAKLLNEIGFKTHVTIDDVLALLDSWRSSKSPFKASLSQMSKLYTFIWKESTTASEQVRDALGSGPFIFVPNVSVKKYDDIVDGAFLSPGEIYWNDLTGAVDLSVSESNNPSCKALCLLYPGLHEFFVKDCGVNEAPSSRHYLHILQQLSRNVSPLQATNAVFQILLRWSDDLNGGLPCPEDLNYLKTCLSQLEYTVLPALQDKWVSLHPSFGLVCWCDDDIVKKEFKYFDNIEFLYFGELTDNKKDLLHAKVSLLLKNLGVPSLSEVVSREAIYCGPADSGLTTSMIDWVLPFAQRYLYYLHAERYVQLKQSEFSALIDLRVVVVEQLFYRNVIKKCGLVSKKRFECSSLLEGSTLYTTCLPNPIQIPDYHSVFMELSRLFFDGTPELHLANFLQMINSMRLSESTTDEQLEHFILNNQKMEKLPVEESLWSLSSPLCLPENDELLLRNAHSISDIEQYSSKHKRKLTHSSWPPANWRSAPGFSRSYRNETEAVAAEDTGNLETDDADYPGSMEQEEPEVVINDDVIIEDDGIIEPAAVILPPCGNQIAHSYDFPQSSTEALADPANIVVQSVGLEEARGSRKDPLHSNTPGAKQAVQAGRQGELVAFKHYVGKVGQAKVNWVNKDQETGLPYDIVIGEGEENREYVEVKASRYAKKDWFEISTREWQFAAEKGDSFSIAHVILSGKNLAKIVIYKNPVKLCQLGKLRLAVMTPKSYQEGTQ